MAVSTFGSEYEYLIRHILPFQEVFFLCTTCRIDVSRSKNEFFLDKDDKGQCVLKINLFENCSKCKAYVRAKFRIKPFCLFATPLRNQKNIPDIDKISITDIPKTLDIDNTVFNNNNIIFSVVVIVIFITKLNILSAFFI